MYSQMNSRLVCLAAVVAAFLCLSPFEPAWAQQPGDATPPAPSPAPGDLMIRQADGSTTVRAMRLPAPLSLDGRLDEEIYRRVPALTGFVQEDPSHGEPATQRTEVWLFFDDQQVYVSARCWTDHPERIVANEMRRDNPAIFMGNDNFAFMFDTFHDRRNSVLFNTNPVGGRTDTEVTNEGQAFSQDWNPVWRVKTGRFEQGWTIEAAIPFTSLRYRTGREQVWGFNARRTVPWNNEISFLVPMPAGYGVNAIVFASRAATLVGLEAPTGMRRVELKPFATANVRTDRAARPPVTGDVGAEVGLDAKLAVSQNLTADFTYNTDFAQVEADDQQVNLTRFSLFFPEKREFFLENSGAFAFGSAGSIGGDFGGGDVPNLFYSRRIGLESGQAVPIVAGGRLTGRIGRTSVGALNIQADDEPESRLPATNFTVLRLRRDLLRRSSVGMIYTGRSVAQAGGGRSDAYGVDAAFAFFDSVSLTGYWAKTETPGLFGDDASHRLAFDYNTDRYGLQAQRLAIGDHFNPEVGFLRRTDMRKHFVLGRFSPRPKDSPLVRKYTLVGSLEHITNGDGRLDSREAEGEFAAEFQTGDRVLLSYSDFYEFLPGPFPIGHGVTLPIGGYGFRSLGGAFTLSPRRPLSATLVGETGTFYNGTKSMLSLAQGRVELTPRFSVQPTVSVNWINLDQGSFRTTLAGSRVTFTMTPLMFVSALVQYNSSNHSAATNVRLRWEYQPGSELFVVFNEQRDTLGARFPRLANRAFVVKINRLLIF
jgi:hypothetical protein